MLGGMAKGICHGGGGGGDYAFEDQTAHLLKW